MNQYSKFAINNIQSDLIKSVRVFNAKDNNRQGVEVIVKINKKGITVSGNRLFVNNSNDNLQVKFYDVNHVVYAGQTWGIPLYPKHSILKIAVDDLWLSIDLKQLNTEN